MQSCLHMHSHIILFQSDVWAEERQKMDMSLTATAYTTPGDAPALAADTLGPGHQRSSYAAFSEVKISNSPIGCS